MVYTCIPPGPDGLGPDHERFTKEKKSKKPRKKVEGYDQIDKCLTICQASIEMCSPLAMYFFKYVYAHVS